MTPRTEQEQADYEIARAIIRSNSSASDIARAIAAARAEGMAVGASIIVNDPSKVTPRNEQEQRDYDKAKDLWTHMYAGGDYLLNIARAIAAARREGMAESQHVVANWMQRLDEREIECRELRIEADRQESLLSAMDRTLESLRRQFEAGQKLAEACRALLTDTQWPWITCSGGDCRCSRCHSWLKLAEWDAMEKTNVST